MLTDNRQALVEFVYTKQMGLRSYYERKAKSKARSKTKAEASS
jgi:hypothetical protein